MGNKTAVGLLLVTSDASMLKCYSWPYMPLATWQSQEALLALQARTKNTGLHLPETKENWRYNLRALGQGIIFINKTITWRLSLSAARLLRKNMRAEEGAQQFSLLWANAVHWDVPGHFHQEPRLRMSEATPLRPFSPGSFASAQLYLIPRTTHTHNTQPAMLTRRTITIHAIYVS